MSRKGHTPEQTLNKPREVEVAVPNGTRVRLAVKQIGVSELGVAYTLPE